MIDPQTKSYVDDAIAKAQKDARYSTKNAASHTHNGIDSPKLDNQALVAGVSQILEGTNITISPGTGTGIVTINSTAGSSGVTSVTASGSGISATPTSGAVVLANTGILSVVGGSNVTVTTTSGVATVNATASGVAANYGDGTDGAVTFDGTTTILGFVPSSSIYTLTRDIFCTTITVNSGVTVKTGSFRLFANSAVVCNGTIENLGNDGANGSVGGAAVGNAHGGVGAGGVGGVAVLAGTLPGTIAGVTGGQGPGGGA
jgi:hypothetical protein